MAIHLTVNYPDGMEMEEDELAAPSLTEVGGIVDEYVKALPDPNYSSLLIVVVPHAAAAARPKMPRLTVIK